MKKDKSFKMWKIYIYGVLVALLILGLAFSYKLYLAGLAGILFFPVLFAYFKRRKLYKVGKKIRCILVLLLNGVIPYILVYIAFFDSTSQDGRGALIRGTLHVVVADLIPLVIGYAVINGVLDRGQTESNNKNAGTIYESTDHADCELYTGKHYEKEMKESTQHLKSRLSNTYLNNVKNDEMTGLQFERYCANILRRTGNFLRVEVTRGSGDFGADIVAIDRKAHKWVWQCKYYKSKLGNTPIQEVVAAKAHYHAEMAGVMTNSTFSKAAWELARDNGVVLIDEERLSNLIRGKIVYKGLVSHEERTFFYDVMNKK